MGHCHGDMAMLAMNEDGLWGAGPFLQEAQPAQVCADLSPAFPPSPRGQKASGAKHQPAPLTQLSYVYRHDTRD